MKKTSKIFMALGGRKSTEEVSFPKYIGVGSVNVLAVNPTKVELEEIYGTQLENSPEYIGENEIEVNGEKIKYPQVRLDFIIKTVPEKNNGIDLKTKVSFFITKEVRYNKDRNKVQVINKYGETTWLSLEDAKAGVIPETLSWFEHGNFKPALIGEEELTGFLKAYLNIPNKSYKKKSGEIVTIPNKEEAEIRLDKILDYFKGDYSEIKNALKLFPENKVKCMFGIKTTDDNKQYQAVYTQKFLKSNISDYSNLDKDLQDRKNNGAYPTTEFSVCDLKEFAVEPTNFSDKINNTESPLDEAPSNWFTPGN